MIHVELLPEQGIAILTPEGLLRREYFESAARVNDPIIAPDGELHGLMSHAPNFPGWADFTALISHLKFVRGHHENFGRVAVVTDSERAPWLPELAGHFVRWELRHFSAANLDLALAWLAARR